MSDRRTLSGYLAAALRRPESWRRDVPHMPTPARPLLDRKGTRWWSCDTLEWGLHQCACAGGVGSAHCAATDGRARRGGMTARFSRLLDG